MTYELDEISQRINAAEAYAADAQQILGDSGDPLARIAAASTLATIATAQLMHRIAGSAALNGAQTEAKTPRCDDQTVLMLAPGSPVVCVCILDDGHGRIHQDADGRRWERTTMDTEPASRAACGSVHTLRNSGNTVVCTRQSGHDAQHSNGDWSWFDDCGNPFSWDPEYTCEEPAGHDGPHSAAGYRWGDGYCLNVYPADRSRLCVLDRGHAGMCSDHTVTWDAEPVTSDGHVHGVTEQHIARHLETIARAVRGGRVTSRDVINLTSVTQSLAQIVTGVTPPHVPAAADLMIRRPIPGRIRYMAERLEGVLTAMTEDRIGRGDLGVLGGIVIALAQIADDMETETIVPDDSGRDAPVLPKIGDVVHYTDDRPRACHRATVVDHVNGQLMLRVAYNDSVGHFTCLAAEDPWRGPNATTVGPHNDYTANTWHPTH